MVVWYRNSAMNPGNELPRFPTNVNRVSNLGLWGYDIIILVMSTVRFIFVLLRSVHGSVRFANFETLQRPCGSFGHLFLQLVSRFAKINHDSPR